MKKPLIVIAGPTASGKSKTSVELAKQINGEIISADSMQVYRGMTIGTAKVTTEEMSGVRHHMIDVLDPNEAFSIAKFQKMVKAAMEDIYSRGKVPILAGGTGFYIQAIVNDIEFVESESDKAYRNSLEVIATTKEGPKTLFEQLMTVDPESCSNIHINNVKRVIRALEYHHLTGEKISTHNAKEKTKTSPYNVCYYVLTMDRDYLYQRINDRVDLMVVNGLVGEVTQLLDQGYSEKLLAMQGLGYKEIVDYIQGRCTLETSIEVLKRDTRHFAKRQLTWFRRESLSRWVDVSKFKYNIERIVNYIIKDIEESKILYYN